MKGVGRTAVWAVAILFLALPALATYGPQFVRGAVKVNAPAAADLTCSFPIDHICPANANRLNEQSRQPTTPTTAPRPYGPANGPVRPLPSVTPAAPLEPTPRALGTGGGGLIGTGGGGILGKVVPQLAPVIEGGIKAIGPVKVP